MDEGIDQERQTNGSHMVVTLVIVHPLAYSKLEQPLSRGETYDRAARDIVPFRCDHS